MRRLQAFRGGAKPAPDQGVDRSPQPDGRVPAVGKDRQPQSAGTRSGNLGKRRCNRSDPVDRQGTELQGLPGRDVQSLESQVRGCGIQRVAGRRPAGWLAYVNTIDMKRIFIFWLSEILGWNYQTGRI